MRIVNMRKIKFLTLLVIGLLSASAIHAENLFSSLLGKSQKEVDERLEQLWLYCFTPGDIKLFDAEGQKTVYYETSDGMAFVMDTGSNDVRSEGMS